MLADQKSQQLSDLVRKKAYIEVENEQLEETSRIKESQLPVLESELYKVEGINKQLRSEHLSLREQKEKLVQELENLAGEAALHETIYISNEAQKQKFEEELTRLQNFIRDTTHQMDTQLQELSKKSKQTEKIKASLNRIFKEKEEELAEVSKLSAELELEVSTKESQIKVLEQKLAEAYESIDKQHRKLDDVTRTKDLLQEKFQLQQKELIELEAREFSSKLKADYIDRNQSMTQTKCGVPKTQMLHQCLRCLSMWSRCSDRYTRDSTDYLVSRQNN